MAMPATTLTDRAVVRLSGEDVRGFVQGLVTSDVNGTLPVWAGLLTPQGKCLFDFIVWGDGDEYIPAGFAGAYADALGGDARVEIVSGSGHWVWVDQPEVVDTVTSFLLAP